MTKSPIKWVGGKATEIKYFDKYIPEYETYVEPFVGGGALFWYLQPKKAILNDINEYLINFYVQVRDNYTMLLNKLQKYINTKDEFNNQVRILNSRTWNDDLEKATLFYYINRTCFSGKWRLNSKGEFNNTFGSYDKDHFKNLDRKYSELLQGIEIHNKDYKEIFDEQLENSKAFMFLDPPYLDCDAMYTESQNFEDIYKHIVYYMTYSKAKIMLVVKSDDYLKKLFNQYIVEEYNKNYRHNAVSTKVHKHLIICNY